MSKISTQALTFCNFFSEFIHDTESNRLTASDQRKAFFAKVACTILSLGIIPTICWIVKRCNHKSPENMTKTEQAVNGQGLQILNKEKNSDQIPQQPNSGLNHPQTPSEITTPQNASNEIIAPKLTVLKTNPSKNPEGNNSLNEENNSFPQKQPTFQPDLSLTPPIKEAPTNPVITPSQPFDESTVKSDTKNSVNAVSKEPSSKVQRYNIFVPKDSLSTFDSIFEFKEVVQQALNLTHVTFAPVQDDPDFFKGVKETSFVVYPINIDDRINNIESKIKDLQTLKKANPNLYIALIIISLNDLSKAIPKELEVDDIIFAQKKVSFNISGVGGFQLGLANGKKLFEDIRSSLQKSIQRLS